MNSNSLAGWVQILTGLALVVGIGLVIWELQQARQLAEAQFAAEAFHEGLEANVAIIGEDGAAVFAKACDNPDSLTSADARIMEAITLNRLYVVTRRLVLYRTGGFYGDDPEIGWSRFAEPNFGAIFGTQFGRNWWKTTRDFWDPEITAVGDDVLASLGPPSCRAFYDGLLGKQSGTTPDT